MGMVMTLDLKIDYSRKSRDPYKTSNLKTKFTCAIMRLQIFVSKA